MIIDQEKSETFGSGILHILCEDSDRNECYLGDEYQEAVEIAQKLKDGELVIVKSSDKVPSKPPFANGW